MKLKKVQMEFTLQRSGNGTALNDHGSSTYTFSDPASVINTAFYRLKLLNKNNSEYKYSKIVSVYNTKALPSQ